jgi:hypothetical protein
MTLLENYIMPINVYLKTVFNPWCNMNYRYLTNVFIDLIKGISFALTRKLFMIFVGMYKDPNFVPSTLYSWCDNR